MTRAKINKRIVGERIDWIDRMVVEIRSLPLENFDEFTSENRNVWTCESCLRRALEALLDLGRHILAKGFGVGVSEYKEIAEELKIAHVLSADESALLKVLAGYRNRLVHFYHEITTEELYDIGKNQLDGILLIKDALIEWLKTNPEKLSETL
jgi:uncharacterized protein YutE (UPF0331/DUF86 family)